MFYLLTQNLAVRTALIEHLKNVGIVAPFHYVPLHTSPMGLALGYERGMLPVTESISERLLRLPMYPTLTATEIADVIDSISSFYGI